jgi:tetratricopeptide (TPR) repeat protein/O-antigen ligase
LPTKLSRYAEGIMEAAWLAAVIVVPVFFDVYSSRIFEPDKITLLRSLALVILAAWVVKLVEQGGVRWERVPRQTSSLRGSLQALLRIPLIAPVSGLALVYLLSTLFSVTPYTSFWGSYQRLQGTYTTLSYLVIFAAMAANLRSRAQVDRLVGAMILSSLPVSLYGVLQRFGADPIPWGGDVTDRIASNMGNSIFVAAYLIMVFPLTLMRVVESFEALMKDPGAEDRAGSNNAPNFVRATIYVFILALQAIALYFSGSRGPWLGWGAGLVLLWLGLSLIWRKRLMTVTGVVLALLAGAFLLALNIPGGPLEALRSRPEFGRLGQLLDAESRTGRVRTLIWQGASELVQPHAPLDYPDGRQDVFNILRPLIGYGPESMYVAYNRFYQPELTLVEKRNASPDRSHNETWDSLVITGLLGLLAYLTLFGAVIYYGLKWLGLVPSQKWRNFFLGLYLLTGLVVAGIFWLWKGVAYLGVALPFGTILGVIVYLIVISLVLRLEAPASPLEKLRAYLLLGLVAAVIAHFVEINFGIAIASTRTYFWVSSALILLVGYILPLYGVYRQPEAELSPLDLTADSPVGASQVVTVSSSATGGPALSGVKSDPRKQPQNTGRSKNRSATRSDRSRKTGSRASTRANGAGIITELAPWLRQSLFSGLLVGIALFTLGYLYISNISRSTNAVTLIWNSLTRLTVTGTGNSYGLLALVLTTWLLGGLLLVSEWASVGEAPQSLAVWGKMVLVTLGVAFFTALIFWLWHAGGLAALNRNAASTIEEVMGQVRSSEYLLTRYYLYLLGLVFVLGFTIAPEFSTPPGWPATGLRWQVFSLATALAVFLVSFGMLAYTNLRVIQADISFKTAELFARPGSWPVAIQIYDRARNLAPNEDYYYLFLGRAYLEYAKSLQDPVEREGLISQAAQDLKEAQRINPLNTDHTANLARLYSLWTTYTDNPDLQAQRAEQADGYFAKAVSLSPKNSRLWDEWAVHRLNGMDDPDGGYERLQRALEIDPYYDWTYALIADYLARFASNAPGITPERRQEILQQAIDNYGQALERVDPNDLQSRYNYLIALGGVNALMGQTEKAIEVYEQARQLWPDHPDSWRLAGALAQLYANLGQVEPALAYARRALETAPASQQDQIKQLIQQLGGTP